MLVRVPADALRKDAGHWQALRSLLEPAGHYLSKDRWLRMDPNDEHDKLLPDLLIARDMLARQWNVNEFLPRTAALPAGWRRWCFGRWTTTSG